MKQTKFARILSLVLCFALVAAVALFTVGCNDNKTPSNPSSGQTESSDSAVLGQGATSVTVSVTFKDGSEKTYTVKTDKTTLGDALIEVGLISGTQGDYGLMVETVGGQTVKYDVDGKYWAFYIDGEYAMSGVDTTDITDGATYAFKVE